MIGIGLSPIHYANELPGWQPNSFGYHSDDGNLWAGDEEKGVKYGTPYKSGDTIGCGIHNNQSIYWTKNGKFLGYHTPTTTTTLPTALYPTVGSNCPSSLCITFDVKYSPEGAQLQRSDRGKRAPPPPPLPPSFSIVNDDGDEIRLPQISSEEEEEEEEEEERIPLASDAILEIPVHLVPGARSPIVIENTGNVNCTTIDECRAYNAPNGRECPAIGSC